MKKNICFIVFVVQLTVNLNAAAYSQSDYLTFVVMQKIAQSHFIVAEQLNQKCKQAAEQAEITRPASYWLKDSRDSMPTPSHEIVLEQGLLYNLKSSILYSRYGAWCFSSDKMYKCAQGGEVARVNNLKPWKRFLNYLVKHHSITMRKTKDLADCYVITEFQTMRVPELQVNLPQDRLASTAGLLGGLASIRYYWDKLTLSVPQIHEYIDQGAEEEHLPESAEVRSQAEQGLELLPIEPGEKQERLSVAWQEMLVRYKAENM